jgi:hypothetical protein
MTYYCVHCARPYQSSHSAYLSADEAWDAWRRKNNLGERELAQAIRRSNAFMAAADSAQAALLANPIAEVSGTYRGARWWRTSV